MIIGIITPPLSVPFIELICEMVGIAVYSSIISAYLFLPISFIVFLMLANYFAAVLGGEGDTKRATAIIIVGNIVNIILDPFFIFNLDMGMFGVGFATIKGYFVSFALFLYLFYIKMILS